MNFEKSRDSQWWITGFDPKTVGSVDVKKQVKALLFRTTKSQITINGLLKRRSLNMTNQQIKHILRGKGVESLYHANTVGTSVTFLENGGLLSRGAVESAGLYQTSQQTDDKDRVLGVFYDIFFDSVDIHSRARKRNDYGPVTFEYSLNLIDSLPENSVKITKENPIYWSEDMPEEERYFMNETELEAEYFKGDFKQHFTITQQMRPLPFTYLNRIILDDLRVSDQDDILIYWKAIDHIHKLMNANDINVPFVVRKCPAACGCFEQYANARKGYIWHKFGFKE